MTLAKVIISPYKQKNVLKGQHIQAQGNAMVINAITNIVRAIMAGKEKFSFRTKWMILCFPENYVLQFRPNEIICHFHPIHADGFSGDSFTRGVAPGFAILPLQGEESQKHHIEKNRNKY